MDDQLANLKANITLAVNVKSKKDAFNGCFIKKWGINWVGKSNTEER